MRDLAARLTPRLVALVALGLVLAAVLTAGVLTVTGRSSGVGNDVDGFLSAVGSGDVKRDRNPDEQPCRVSAFVKADDALRLQDGGLLVVTYDVKDPEASLNAVAAGLATCKGPGRAYGQVSRDPGAVLWTTTDGEVESSVGMLTQVGPCLVQVEDTNPGADIPLRERARALQAQVAASLKDVKKGSCTG